VPPPMLFGRGSLGGENRAFRRRFALVLLVLLLVVSSTVGFALFPGGPSGNDARGAGSTAASTPSAITPDQTPPLILGFTATPSILFPGNVTVLRVTALPGIAGDVLSYSYSNLPGCASANTSALACAVEFVGNWSVTVAVTDTNVSNPATSYDSVLVTVLWGSAVTGEGQYFDVNSSTISNLNDSDAACTSIATPPFYQNYCYPEAQDPILLNLPHGEVGLVSQEYTNLTSNTCTNAAKHTVARIGFALSETGGATFAPALTLGNNTCRYLNAIEPAFTAVGSDIYGAFIEENSSALAANYINRSGDAIGFVKSTNGGASWSGVTTIATGVQFARPAIAASGPDIYVAYDRLANTSRLIGGAVQPISVNVLSSTDSGTVFSGPFKPPGLNASAGYTAMSPAIAVSASGTLAVAYATDRSCLSLASGTCYEYADEIVVVTSTSHGVTWVGPTVAGRGAGESACYSGACLPGFFESTPQIALSYAPTGDHLYVVWAAVYSEGPGVLLTPMSPTGIFAAESSNGGTSWSTRTIAAPTETTLVRSFDPGLAVASSGAAVTYLQLNASAGFYGFANSLSQWWDSTPLGGSMHWGPPNALNIDSFVASGGAVNATRTSYAGDSSAVAFNTTTGQPIVAFPIPYASTQTISHGVGYYYINTTYSTSLAVGLGLSNGSSDAVAILFYESGLPAGETWQFELNGIYYTTDQPAVYFDALPLGATVIDGALFQAGYWEIVANEYYPTTANYYSSSLVDFNFQVYVGLEFFQFPGGIGPWISKFFGFEWVTVNVLYSPFPFFADANWYQEEVYNFLNNTFTPESEIQYFGAVGSYDDVCPNYQCSYPSPWYFPLGATVEVEFEETAYNMLPPIWWTGTGNGNYTGPMQGTCFFGCQLWSGPIQMNGPINETAWLGSQPTTVTSNLTVSASGLPASSQFDFSLDGTPYSSGADVPVTVYGIPAGAHAISDLSASSTEAGYEYFGSVTGPNPFVTPIEVAVQLNFTSLVEVGAPLGTVTFYAPALDPGTSWSLVFNGTSYSSSVPWINVTTRNGTYEWAPGDAVNPDGTTGYTPTTPGGPLSVTTGGTYTVDYQSAVELEVLAATGGLVAINGGPPSAAAIFWASPGTQASLTGITSPGYALTGWSGTGDGSYNGSAATPEITLNGPVVESASFAPLPGARFSLTFVASGLPPGAWWSVDVGGYEHSSNTSYIVVPNLWPWSAGTSGEYPLSVPDAYPGGANLTRYVAQSPPTVVGTNGTFTPPVPIVFAPRVLVTVAGSSGGSVELTYGGLPAGTSDWIPLGAEITATAVPNPGFTFAGWLGTGGGSYSGPLASVAFNATGPVQEVATFSGSAPTTLPRFALTFSLASSLPSGTEWSVTFGGQGYSSTGASLTIPDLATGTYSVQLDTATAPSGLVQYRASASDPVAYTVTGNATVPVSYSPYFWVSVSGSVGGSTQPAPGWFAAASVLYLVATPNGTNTFTGWVGTGNGSYTGPNGTVALIVNGPLTEVATFRSSSTSAAASSVWTDPTTWIGIGAAALIVGILAGVLAARLRRRPAPPSAPAPAPPRSPGGGPP
jgi:hypothetical protein